MPKIVPQYRKLSHNAENCRTVPKMSHSISLYIETNYRMLLPILLIDSAFGSRLHILIHWTDSAPNQNRSRHPIRIEHGKKPSTSSANQNRVLRHPNHQPIRIEHYLTWVEHYVTRELSATVEVPSRLSARVGSL